MAEQQETQADSTTAKPFPAWRLAALVLGPCLALGPLVIEAPADLSPSAWRLCGLATWMVVWWLSVVLGLVAAALHFPIDERPIPRPGRAAS